MYPASRVNHMDNHLIDIDSELIALTQQLLIESGQTYKREIKLDLSLTRHLGIDSLARAELFQRIEKKFSVTLPDRLLVEAETLNDIANYLHTLDGAAVHTKKTKMMTSKQEAAHFDLTHAHTLMEVLALYAEKTPNKTHVYFQTENGEEEIITYQQLLIEAARVAHSLKVLGLKENETAAIMLPTHPHFLYSFFGVLLAGGIPVPIYPPFRAHMLETYTQTEARILRNAEVRVLITFEKAEKLSQLLKAFIPSLKHVVTADALLQAAPLTHYYQAKADSFALIQYTSGSTSDPKGVLLSHHNLLANIRAYGQAIKVTADDVSVSWLPLYHDMGLIGLWLGSLYHGIPLVLMTPFAFLNHPEKWLWAIHYHRGTLSGAPNFAYELCIRKIDAAKLEGLDLSCWRIAANGAEKIYPRTLNHFAERFAAYGFKRHALLPVYGLAESTVSLTIPPIKRDFRVDYVDREFFEKKWQAQPSTAKNALAFVSCGIALPQHAIRIVDEKDQALIERQVGHLQFCGPSSMQAYYNNPRATQAIYHNGWLATGDLAYIADGELYITGRAKDLIIKAGRNLYPAEIEELIAAVAGVRQGCVAAFGVTDANRGTEQLIVAAETTEKNRQKRESIIAEIKQKMAEHLDSVPDQVLLVAPRRVPKTSSGKLQRAACKTLYLQGRLTRAQLPPWLQVLKLAGKWLVQQSGRLCAKLLKAIYTAYAIIVLTLGLLPVYCIIRFSSQTFAAKLCRRTAKWLRRACLCPLTVINHHYLTQTSPLIFSANHCSYVDSFILVEILPPGTLFVGKKELFLVPILRTFMRQLGYLSVDRLDLSKGLEDTKLIEHALSGGRSILIFPEGTFGYAAGLRPFRLGAFKIAAETQTAVCPLALQGTRVMLRGEEKLLRPSWITITVCEPILPHGKEWQDIIQLRQKVREEIAKYCGEPMLDFIAAQTVASSHPPKSSAV